MFSEVKRFRMLDTDLIEVIERKNVFLVKFKEAIRLFPVEPLFAQKTGHQTSTTKWFCFMKIPSQKGEIKK